MRRAVPVLWILTACSDHSKAPPPRPRPPATPLSVDAAPVDAAIDAAPWMLGERPLLPDAGNEQPRMCTEPAACASICDGGDGQGCYWLGIMYITKSDVSMGVPFDPQKGVDLLLRSCDYGITLGCNGAAQILRMGSLDLPVDAPRAKRLFTKACELGMEYACKNAKGM